MTALPALLGQPRAKAVLDGLLATGRLPHAILFGGPDGTGKTLAAMAFAKALLCPSPSADRASCGACPSCEAAEKGNHPDLARVNPDYQAALRGEEPERQRTIRVETVRHLRRQMELSPLSGRRKAAVLESAETLEPESANALLKILEEPDAASVWVLVSPAPERLPRTVLSRCFRVSFQPLAPETVAALLAARGLAGERASRLSRLCEGSVSRALELAERELPDRLLSGPGAAAEAAEGLPRDLASARAETERALFSLSQLLRLKHLDGEVSWARAAKPLAELGRLRSALRSNADPRNVLLLACLEAETALT